MFWVYVLRSGVTGRRYTGSCEDLDRRLNEHNSGHSPATRHGVPWTLVYRESLPTKAEAVRRELHFKTGKGRDELDCILKGTPPG
jgi:putative endonuclease